MSDNYIFNLVRRSITEYGGTIKKYRDYSSTWKKKTTCEIYFRQMNELEDAIDCGLAYLVNNTNRKLEKLIARYEMYQDLREEIICKKI